MSMFRYLNVTIPLVFRSALFSLSYPRLAEVNVSFDYFMTFVIYVAVSKLLTNKRNLDRVIS